MRILNMTRRKLLFIILPLFLIIVSVCLIVFVSSDYFLEKVVKDRVIRALQDQVNDGYTVQIPTMYGNIFTGIVIEDLSIKEVNSDVSPILSTDRLVLKYNFLALLRRKLVVNNLKVVSPSLKIIRNSDGHFNITQVFRKTSSTSAEETDKTFAFAVGLVSIEKANLSFSDTHQNIKVSLPDIRLDLAGPIDTWDHKGEFSIGKGKISLNETEIPIEELVEMEFAISTKGTGLIDPFKLKIGNSLLNIVELNHDSDKSDWHTQVELTVDAGDFQQIIPNEFQIAGICSVKMDLTGTGKTINGSLSASSDTLSFSQLPSHKVEDSTRHIRQVELSDLKVETILSIDENLKMGLNTFSANIANGTLSGSGNLSFNQSIEGNILAKIQQFLKQPFFYESQWNISNVELGSLLTKLLEVPDEMPNVDSASLFAKASVNGNSNGDFQLDSNVQVLDTNLIVNQTESISLRDSSIECSMSSDTGSGSNITVNGNLDATVIDVSGSFESIVVNLSNIDFGKILRVFNSVPFKGFGDLQTVINRDGTADGHLVIHRALYGDADSLLGHLSSKLKFNKDVVYFENAKLTKKGVNGDTNVSIDGNVKLAGKLPTSFNIVAKSLALDNDYSNIFFQQEFPIQGKFSGELNLFGTLIDNLDGKGSFTVESGNAWGINLEPASLPLVIDDYSLTISNFVIKANGQQVVLNAHASDDGEFQLTIENSNGKPIQLAKIALAAEVIDFPLDGNMDIIVTSYQKKHEKPVFEVDFEFKDLTFEGNPLGDAVLHGVLMQDDTDADFPDFFSFTGNAFEGTTKIEGKIISTPESPYLFTLQNTEYAVTPILRILDRRLEAVSGTVDGSVKVEGTIEDLIGPAGPSKERLFPYTVDIAIDRSNLEFNSVDFTNYNPIRLKLEDDIFSFIDSSLVVVGEQVPFVELIGTFDLKNEQINIIAQVKEKFPLDHIASAFELPISGIVSYQISAKGDSSNPDLKMRLEVPDISVNTDSGEISIRSTDSEFVYEDGIVHITPFSLQLMDNDITIGGTVSVDRNEIERSTFNLDITCGALELAKYSDIIRSYVPIEFIRGSTGIGEEFITGELNVSLNVGGSLAEPIIKVNSRSNSNNPIKSEMISNGITLNQLSVDTVIGKEEVHLQNLTVLGQIGNGRFRVNGDTSISTIDSETMRYNIEVSVEKLDFADFSPLILANGSLQSALVSGNVLFTGTGIIPDLANATGKIDELNLNFGMFNVTNLTTIAFSLNDKNIHTDLSLHISSDDIEAKTDISITGLLTSPQLSANWQGTVNSPLFNEVGLPLQFEGNVVYVNNSIDLSVELTNNNDKLTLKGSVPFNLSFSELALQDRFIDAPIEVQLIGKELPFDFFPGLNSIINEAEGVTDIDLKLQGTLPDLFLQGTVYTEAPVLTFHNYDQQLSDIKIELIAKKDSIGFGEFSFKVANGSVELKSNDQNRLILDGLTPQSIELFDLSVSDYPIGSSLGQAIPENIVGNLVGALDATLKSLYIPLNQYFERSGKNPFPALREELSFASLTEDADMEFSVDSVSIGFSALEQSYNFKNPQPIPIVLTSGEFKVMALKIENTSSETDIRLGKPLTFSSFGKWNPSGGMLLNMRMDNLDMSSLNRLFSAVDLDSYQLAGFLSLEVNITGSLTAPEIEVKLDSDLLSINQARIDEFSGRLQYISDDNEWSIAKSDPVRLRIGKNELTCSGTVPYQLSLSQLKSESLAEPMEIVIALELEDMGILSVIEPAIESADGKGRLTATIHGTSKSPKLKGEGVLHSVSLILQDSPILLEETYGNFLFSESNLIIQTVDGILNGGDFFAKGQIVTDWFQVNYIDLTASLDNCIFAEPGQYLANISSGDNELHLKGAIGESNENNLTISGDIIIHSGEYEQNWENVRDWFSGSTVSGVELTFGNTILDSLQLDLGIDIPEDFHFRTSLTGSTNIEINCNGRLTGLIQEPIFTGEVTILKGKISIVTQEFDIVEGSRITNLDDTAFNPRLDIILKAPNPIRGVLLENGSTADLLVTATVTGVLPNGDIDKARVDFQADPLNSSTTEIFSDADILALLLPGSSISRSFGGITFTISSGFDPNERHIIGEYPLPNNMSIKVEGDERGDFGVDVQLLERRF